MHIGDALSGPQVYGPGRMLEFYWIVECGYRGLPESVGPVRNPIGANMSMRTGLALEVGGSTSRSAAWARGRRAASRPSWPSGSPQAGHRRRFTTCLPPRPTIRSGLSASHCGTS